MAEVRKFIFDVGWGLVASLITLAIGFFMRIFLARWLGPDDLGLYSMVVMIQSYSIFVGSLGVPIALTKYAAEYRNNPEKLTEASSNAFITVIMSGFLIGAILYILSWTLGDIFHMAGLSHLIRIISGAIPLGCGILAILNLFTGMRRMKIFALLVLVQGILTAIIQVFFVSRGLGVDGAAWGIMLSTSVTFVFGIFLFRKLLRFNLYSLRYSIHSLLAFSSLVFFAEALNMIPLYADTMTIGYFLNATQVGYYSIALTLAGFFPIIPQAIQKITYPATSEYWSNRNRQALRIMIDKSTKYSACILLPIGLVVGFFSSQLISRLFGAEFIPASSALKILVISSVIKGGTIVAIGSTFTGMGRPDLPLKLSAVTSVTDVALNIILVPSIGILGAATASAITSLVGVILFLTFMQKILSIQIDLPWYGKAAALTSIAIALFWGATKYFSPYLVGSIILCIYIILIGKYLLTREDRNIFRSLIWSLIPKSSK